MMDPVEFSGIQVEPSGTGGVYDQPEGPEVEILDAHSGEPVVSLPRRRNNINQNQNHLTQRTSDELELEKLRKLVAEAERRESVTVGCQRGSIEPSLMSTVFLLVLCIIITITIYAFFSLYQALVKRFFNQ